MMFIMIRMIKCDTNNTGNWNHHKIIQKISEQHTQKHDIKELLYIMLQPFCGYNMWYMKCYLPLQMF